MKINQLLESAQSPEQVADIATRLIEKWEPTGLLEGSDLSAHLYGKEHMAILLESQAKQVITEATTQTNFGGATFQAGAGEQWAQIALPLVRKIYADISAQEFMNRQPISAPSGLVFFLDFKFANQQPTIGAGGTSRFNVGDSIYGTTDQTGDAFGGLYGAGRWGYSINELSANVTFQVTTASFADVNFNSAYSASAAAGRLRKLTLLTASAALPKLDTHGVRSFVVTGSGISEGVLFAEFSKYDSSDAVSFVVTASAGLTTGSTATATVYYSKQTTDNDRGDFEDRSDRPLTGSASIPKMDIGMRSETIAAKTRKMATEYTQEVMQDYNAYQSIDVESEVTSVIGEHLSVEIDMELLDMINNAANINVEVWSARANRFFDATTNSFYDAAAGAGGFYNTQGEWFATLGTKLQKVSRTIHQKTLRGQANVLMTSPKISTVIESIAGWAPATDGEKLEYAFGTQKIGSIGNRWKVIVNPYMQENAILMAFKGSNFLETGASFLPYIPLMSTPIVYNPETFTLNKGFMTRYAKKMIRKEFFGKVLVADLDVL